jgi:hypothetical protein
MKLGGINVKPDPNDVTWLTDPANPTIIMGTPLAVYRMIAVTVAPLIRGGHVSPSPRVTTRTWELSVIHFPRGKYQHHCDQVCFNDGGARFPTRDHRRPGKDVHGTSWAPQRHRAMLIELNARMYSSNLGNRWASFPSASYSIAVSNSGFLFDIMSE